MEAGQYPEEGISERSPIYKSYWAQWKSLVARDGVLESHWESADRIHFSVTIKLHSDQGPNFESRLMQEILEQMGVRKTRITPLHLLSNGMVERYEGDREVREEGGLYPLKGLGWEATHLPVGLTSINQWNHWCDTCQHGVRPRASPALWPYDQGSPRQGSWWQNTQVTLANGYTTSTILPASTWKWPVTRWRHDTISWPILLVFKKVTECGCTALPIREEDHPSCRRTEKAHTLSPR